MFEMVKQHLRRHKYKIVVGLPMAVLLASSLSLVRDPAEVCIVPTDNRYVELGTPTTLEVLAQSDEPINVISATVVAPPDRVTIKGVSTERSIISLWSEEPTVDDAQGTVHFSGGILRPEGFVGSGEVLSVQVVPQTIGETTITLEDVHMLAHDGTGTEVNCGSNPFTLIVREDGSPSPDVNSDTHVNILDMGLISANILLTYEPLYDLNKDGKVSLSDLLVIFKLLRGGE